jgi:hypothetical protein
MSSSIMVSNCDGKEKNLCTYIFGYVSLIHVIISIGYVPVSLISATRAGLGGGGVTSSPANPKVAGSSPTWVVYPSPRAWVSVCPNLIE